MPEPRAKSQAPPPIQGGKTRPSAAAKPQFKFRMRVTRGELVAIGPGKVALLQALHDTRSITAAAKALGMSYRRAWLLVDELNQSLREPAVVSASGGAQGGGSELTPFGLQLMALYRGIETKAQQACEAEIARLMKMLAKP